MIAPLQINFAIWGMIGCAKICSHGDCMHFADLVQSVDTRALCAGMFVVAIGLVSLVCSVR